MSDYERALTAEQAVRELRAENARLTEDLFVLRNSEALDSFRADVAEAEVARLTAELAAAHRTIDDLCRSIGRIASGTTQ